MRDYRDETAYIEIRMFADSGCKKCKGAGIWDYKERDPSEPLRMGGPPHVFRKRSICKCLVTKPAKPVPPEVTNAPLAAAGGDTEGTPQTETSEEPAGGMPVMQALERQRNEEDQKRANDAGAESSRTGDPETEKRLKEIEARWAAATEPDGLASAIVERTLVAPEDIAWLVVELRESRRLRREEIQRHFAEEERLAVKAGRLPAFYGFNYQPIS